MPSSKDETETPKWLTDVEDKDYEAAFNYLTLKLDSTRAADIINKLRKASVYTRRANDIIRATGLAPLPRKDPGVAKDLRKIHAGKSLSPVLVVSFEVGGDIADGFHRVSAVYSIDPFADVPLKIANAYTSNRRAGRHEIRGAE